LAARGVPVTPTTFVGPQDDIATTALPDGDLVVKPAVGAGSLDTERYVPERHDDALAHIGRLQDQGRVVMVQPYLHGVDTEGETACIHFNGAYSHAIRKGPILRPDGTTFVEGLYAAEEITAREPSEAERAVAELVLAAVPFAAPLLYARVDLVPGPDG